jgi:carboxypeptidase Q
MRRLVGVSVALVAALAVLAAEERPDEAMFWKIRQEATARSQILQTLHVLTDVYGPRLTGSPNLKAAGEWAVQQMTTWGLQNGHLEPWDFGRDGWGNERVTAHLITPVKDALVVEVLAWTPSTTGVARGQAMQITLPTRPSATDLTDYLESIKSTVKGKMVPVTFNPAALRREDADVVGLLNTPPAQTPTFVAPPRADQAAQRVMTNAQIQERVNQFLRDNGALVRINDAGRDHGQIRAFDNATRDVNRAPPTVVMRNEDYGRISRLLADKRQVELEFEIVNRSYPEGRTSYNVIAEIPGTDKTDEVVMLGGHLDSWHAATGATDNAIGCSVMMEAVRILTAIGAKPRRTIRVALWSGEEQGLLGSAAYVRQHFGTFEDPKAEYSKLSAYLNMDSGTGRIRAFTAFGPSATGDVLREATASFKDLGMLGATNTRSRGAGGTDSTNFNAAGLPGINTLLDPIQYQTYTWHTNLDTYERIVEDDVKKAAIVIAGAVYHLAMRDELLPRFSKDDMPRPFAPAPPPAPSSSTSGAPAPATRSN